MRGPDPPTIWNVGKQGHSSDQHYLFLIIMAFSLFLSFMGTQNSSDLSSCRTNTLCFSGSSAASKNFLLSTTFIFFLFFVVWLQRVRSLEDLLGAVHFHLVAWYLWNLFACGGRSGNVWESASRKNPVARWKVSRWGFRPPWSSPNCGRG